jgi:hypothetical protein
LDYEQAVVRRKHGDVSHASFCAGRKGKESVGDKPVSDEERLCSLVLARKKAIEIWVGFEEAGMNRVPV